MFTFANLKVVGYAVIVLAVIFGVRAGYKAIYSAGWNAAVVEQEKAIQLAKDEARAEEQEFWKEAIRRAEENIRTEEVIVERIKEVEKKIPVVVDRIVEVQPECADLGADFASLLNDQIRASDSGEAGNPADPAVPHP